MGYLLHSGLLDSDPPTGRGWDPVGVAGQISYPEQGEVEGGGGGGESWDRFKHRQLLMEQLNRTVE